MLCTASGCIFALSRLASAGSSGAALTFASRFWAVNRPYIGAWARGQPHGSRTTALRWRGQHRRPAHMVYEPEASAAAAARRRRSRRRVGFADQPPPSPDATFPPPALDIDETDAVSAHPLRAPEGEQLEIQIDKAQTPKVSKQHIAFGRVVRERQAVEAYVPPPKSLTLDPTTGAPIFRSPASKKKYGWTRTPKQTPTKVRRKVKRHHGLAAAAASLVSKYVDRARTRRIRSYGRATSRASETPPPKAPPVFLTEPDEPRSPYLGRKHVPDGLLGLGRRGRAGEEGAAPARNGGGEAGEG